MAGTPECEINAFLLTSKITYERPAARFVVSGSAARSTRTNQLAGNFDQPLFALRGVKARLYHWRCLQGLLHNTTAFSCSLKLVQ